MPSKDKQPAFQAWGQKNNKKNKVQDKTDKTQAVGTTLGNLLNYAASWIPGYQLAKDMANNLSEFKSPINMSLTVVTTFTLGPTNPVVIITKATKETKETKNSEPKPKKPRGRSPRSISRTTSLATSDPYILQNRRRCNRCGQVFKSRDKLLEHVRLTDNVLLDCQAPQREGTESSSPDPESSADEEQAEGNMR